MRDNAKEASPENHTPRSFLSSHRSLTSINNIQEKSPKHRENQNEAAFSQYYVQGSYKSDLGDGLSPQKKRLTKSQSTSGIKSGAVSLTLKRQNLPNNEGVTEPKTVLLKTSTKILGDDMTSLVRKVSVQRGSIREIRTGSSIIGNNEVEDVKDLDSWKLEMKKKKLLKSEVRYTDLTKHSGRSQDANNILFPRINSHVINKILKDENEEKLINEYGEISTRDEARPMGPEENNQSDRDTDLKILPAKSLEVRMRENKDEITNNLVIKKVKRRFKDQNIERMSPDNLKNHIQAIAKETMNNFRSLKGVYPKSKVESCLRIVTDSKRLGNEFPESSNLPNIKGNFQEKTSGDKEYVMNYRDIEVTLRKDLERMTEMAEKFVWKTTQFNGQTKRLENEIRKYEEQIAQLTERSEAGSPPKSLSPGLKKTKFNFDGKNDRNNLYDFQRFRLEQKQQRAELQQKLEETRKIHFDKERELVNAEQALKECKENKSKLKIQLRDLYLNILKDEAYLLKSNSSSNYAWVIQSLWEMNQKIKSEDFPSFLGEEELIYILEYAHAQDALLKFCKEKNLLNFSPDLENLKHPSIRDLLSLVKNMVSPVKQDPVSPSKASKTYESILNEFRNKMKRMKGEHLKSKEITGQNYFGAHASKSTPKLRFIETSQRYSPVSENRSQLEGAFKVDPGENQDSKRLKINLLEDLDESEDRQIVKKVLSELENMKLEESDKMLKRHLMRDLDFKDKEALYKAYIFLFGSQEGKGFYNDFLKEQKRRQERPRVNNINSLKPGNVKVMLSEKALYGFKPANLSESGSYSPTDSPLFNKEKSKALFQTILRSNSNVQNSISSKHQNSQTHSTSLSPVKIKFSSTRQTPFSPF